MFQRNGWTTLAAVSATTLSPSGSGLGRGFDRMLAPEESFQPARTAITWLRVQIRQLDDQPVFAWLHLSDPHLPYSPPPQFSKEYLGKEFDVEDPRLPEPVSPILPLSAGGADREARRYLERLYQAEISSLDNELAPFLRGERFRGGWTAYTSGHGESFGEHGYWWSHAGLYPQTLRVPLILAGPGAGGNGVKARAGP